MELYRVTTHYPLRNGKPGKRTEILQRRWSVTDRIKVANDVAASRFQHGYENEYFVLAEELINGEWQPVDGKFWTAEITYESQKNWNARHVS